MVTTIPPESAEHPHYRENWKERALSAERDRDRWKQRAELAKRLIDENRDLIRALRKRAKRGAL